MALRLAVLSAAHGHAMSYVACAKSMPDVEIVAVWDEDRSRAEALGVPIAPSPEAALSEADAAIVASENTRHADLVEIAAQAGKPMLCEKPLAPNLGDGRRILDALETHGTRLMTAFPCPFAPAFETLVTRIRDGVIGEVLAIEATNHGVCPFGWFVEPELSGGGAMIDHTVHVLDLLRRLLQDEPKDVFAQVGHNMYDQAWEDSALVTVGFRGGAFATIDSSWSRPKGFKTWGDVRLAVTGTEGTMDATLFDMGVETMASPSGASTLHAIGPNLDAAMLREFVDSVREDREPLATANDGWQASRVAIAAYESVRTGRQVVLD